MLKKGPGAKIDKSILQAVSGAIKRLETITGSIKGHIICTEDGEDLETAMRTLWSLLERHDYTIDNDTNRLRRATR